MNANVLWARGGSAHAEKDGAAPGTLARPSVGCCHAEQEVLQR